MKPNGQNGPEWRVFHDSVERMLGDRTGWLGREDSNLRMAESKSRPPQSHRGAGGSIIPKHDSSWRCYLSQLSAISSSRSPNVSVARCCPSRIALVAVGDRNANRLELRMCFGWSPTARARASTES